MYVNLYSLFCHEYYLDFWVIVFCFVVVVRWRIPPSRRRAFNFAAEVSPEATFALLWMFNCFIRIELAKITLQVVSNIMGSFKYEWLIDVSVSIDRFVFKRYLLFSFGSCFRMLLMICFGQELKISQISSMDWFLNSEIFLSFRYLCHEKKKSECCWENCYRWTPWSEWTWKGVDLNTWAQVSNLIEF